MHMITNPSPRDHAEVDLGPAAGVSDRGLRHHRNEDAMALAAEQAPDGPAVVVLDCANVDDAFDARYSATARHYRYRILSRRAPPRSGRGASENATP